MLEIKNLTKTYEDGTQALKNVSFTVDDGEFLVIIGLSGSGKSTLLRCINRLIEPHSGQVILDGVDITAANQAELRRIRRQIGMIFQHFNLVMRLSVLNNVLSGRLGYVSSWRSILGRWNGKDREPSAGVPRKHCARARSVTAMCMIRPPLPLSYGIATVVLRTGTAAPRRCSAGRERKPWEGTSLSFSSPSMHALASRTS